MRLALTSSIRSLSAALTAAIALAACGGNSVSSVPQSPNVTPSPAATVAPAGIWVAAWADAPSNALQSAINPASSEQTFRLMLKPSVGSRGTIRLHFSNIFGTAPITLGAVHIGVHSSGAAVTPGTDLAVAFGGKPSITIPAGATALSDALTMQFSYGTVLAVTEYVSGSWNALTRVNRSIVTQYATPGGAGNATADLSGSTFTQHSGETFLLDRVDVLGSYTKTVAVVGSSTTVGVGADTDQFDDLVSDVAANLHAAGHDDIAVVNSSMAPDSVLAVNDLSLNPSLTERFSRDVLSLPGIATVIDNTADVDLKAATCSNAAAIIAGDQNIIAQAHAAHLRIVLATVAPATFCNGQNPMGFGTRFAAGTGQDAERQALNAWMSTTQPSVVDGVTVQPPGADGVVDLSTPVADPANVAYPLAKYDIGDDSHLTAAGQALQAAAIPLSAL